MFKHREAFCLMQYQDEETGEVEVIWNSRDGVTPFGLTSRRGNPSTHVNWDKDACCPMFIPNVGDRVFVDMTLKQATEFRTRFVEEHWDKEFCGVKMKDSGHWDTKDEAIIDLAASDFADGHSPICVVVTEDMQEDFRRQQQDRWALAGALGHSKVHNSMAGKRFA